MDDVPIPEIVDGEFVMDPPFEKVTDYDNFTFDNLIQMLRQSICLNFEEIAALGEAIHTNPKVHDVLWFVCELGYLEPQHISMYSKQLLYTAKRLSDNPAPDEDDQTWLSEHGIGELSFFMAWMIWRAGELEMAWNAVMRSVRLKFNLWDKEVSDADEIPSDYTEAEHLAGLIFNERQGNDPEVHHDHLPPLKLSRDLRVIFPIQIETIRVDASAPDEGWI